MADNNGLIIPDAKVLFADGEQDNLDMLRVWTNSIGWSGDYVTSASAIIDAVNENCFDDKTKGCYDAIVADINYFDETAAPKHTGITAARAVRKAQPDLPIIFVSAFTSSLIREEVRRVGAAEIIPKPVDLVHLFDRIDHLIYWHRLGRVEDYSEENRRRNSVNRTTNCRRASEKQIVVPQSLTDIMSEVMANKKGGSY